MVKNIRFFIHQNDTSWTWFSNNVFELTGRKLAMSSKSKLHRKKKLLEIFISSGLCMPKRQHLAKKLNKVFPYPLLQRNKKSKSLRLCYYHKSSKSKLFLYSSGKYSKNPFVFHKEFWWSKKWKKELREMSNSIF